MQEDSPQPTDLALEESLRTTWNARVVDYDHARFPFADRILAEIRRLGYPLDELHRLHEHVPESETYVLSKDLCDATNRPEFRRMVHRFVLEEVAPRGGLVAPIAAQRFLNVRIMLPSKPQGVFPFHTGLLYGHGRGSRSLWLPLTDLSSAEDRSATLQIIGLERSRELTREAMRQRLGIREMTELFGRESTPIEAGPGQVVFFSQENIHGNFVNRSGKTRVSIDFRVAEAQYGDQLARKIPGGYFEIITESGARDGATRAVQGNTKTNIIYLNNNTASSENIPAHLQRYMVYEFCARNELEYEFELFELERMNHLPTLLHIVDELECNVLLYSIYSLPESRADRDGIFATAERRGVVLHFVNEDLTVTDGESRERVESLLEFAKYGDHRDRTQSDPGRAG